MTLTRTPSVARARSRTKERLVKVRKRGALGVLLALVAVIGMLAFPTRYQFTTSGVSPNPSVFRPWLFRLFVLEDRLDRTPRPPAR